MDRAFHSPHLEKGAFEKLVQAAKDFDLEGFRTMYYKIPAYIEQIESMPAKVQEAYKAMPFENFYTDKATQKFVYRLYGVAEMLDGTCRYHVFSARLFWTNDVVGGIAADDLLQVDEWSDAHLDTIWTNNVPEAFLMPHGWLMFLNL